MCKVCTKEYVGKYIASGEHKEWAKKSRERARQDPERHARVKERISRKHKEWRQTKPEFREKCRARAKAHYQANKEKYLANVSARKARMLGSGGSHSADAWRQLRELFGNKCLCCGAEGRLTKDHVTPITRGGSDDITNLQPLCLRCNKSKFTRGQDYRTIERVVLPELNEVGKLLFDPGQSAPAASLRKHEPSSGYTGVYYAAKSARSVKVWKARIQVHGKSISLGYYATAEEAARAYNEASRKHFGESAYQNVVADV